MPFTQIHPMKFRSHLWICASALALLTSCAVFKSHPAEKPPPTAISRSPQLIGRIASIPADKRFVLIQSYGNGKLEAGTILTTRGADDHSANLRVTGEALGQFAAADLQSGLVAEGDAVYSRHVPTPTAPPPSAEPAENQPPSSPIPPNPEPELKK